MPAKNHHVEELMHVKYVVTRRPHVGVRKKSGEPQPSTHAELHVAREPLSTNPWSRSCSLTLVATVVKSWIRILVPLKIFRVERPMHVKPVNGRGSHVHVVWGTSSGVHLFLQLTVGQNYK
ncbi:hypothetical protein TNCV_2409471 [Trichonephila clavipes]|nr:hypothetical protein TNCV_2409471 [Trichonephila clavipes]